MKINLCLIMGCFVAAMIVSPALAQTPGKCVVGCDAYNRCTQTCAPSSTAPSGTYRGGGDYSGWAAVGAAIGEWLRNSGTNASAAESDPGTTLNQQAVAEYVRLAQIPNTCENKATKIAGFNSMIRKLRQAAAYTSDPVILGNLYQDLGERETFKTCDGETEQHLREAVAYFRKAVKFNPTTFLENELNETERRLAALTKPAPDESQKNKGFASVTPEKDYCSVCGGALINSMVHGLRATLNLRQYVVQRKASYATCTEPVQCSDAGIQLYRNLGTCDQSDEGGYKACIRTVVDGAKLSQ